jgi:predicted PurR-regulated permease PerM
LLLLVVAVLLPVTWITLVVVREAIHLAHGVAAAIEKDGLFGWIQLAPASLREFLSQQLHANPEWLRALASRLPTQGLALLGVVGGALGRTGALAFELAMLLVALYFLLVDGPKLAAWVRNVSPLGPEPTGNLMESVRATSSSVLLSAFATAAVQALVAWAGFAIARTPEPLFFAALTFFAAFIPSVGTSLVGIPLALFLILSGRWVAGLFLAGWMIGVTGTIDNALKPWLAHGRAALHGGVLFFAMVGGILFFGPLGLVLGPAAISLLLALVKLGRPEAGGEGRSP